MKHEAAEAAGAAASAGLKTALAGSAGLVWGGWTSNDVAMIGGLVLGVIGLIVQIHYKRKAHRLLEEEHAMRRVEHKARMSEFG